MHYWGDEWFDKYGDDLYSAIEYIETNLRKYKIFVSGKEKYGTYRDEYLMLWDGSLHYLLYGTYINHHRFAENLIWGLDYGFLPLKKSIVGWDKYGFTDFPIRKLISKLVANLQAKAFNKVFQTACKKWPHITEELIAMIEGYEMIKPCKWGDVDGKKIHAKYWRLIIVD